MSPKKRRATRPFIEQVLALFWKKLKPDERTGCSSNLRKLGGIDVLSLCSGSEIHELFCALEWGGRNVSDIPV